MEETKKIKKWIPKQFYDDPTDVFSFLKRTYSDNNEDFTDRILELKNYKDSNPTIWMWLCRIVIEFVYEHLLIFGGNKNENDFYISPDGGTIFTKNFVHIIKNLLKSWGEYQEGLNMDVYINGTSIKQSKNYIKTPEIEGINPVYLRIIITEILKNSLNKYRPFKQDKIVYISITRNEMIVSDTTLNPSNISKKELEKNMNNFRDLQSRIIRGIYNKEHHMSLTACSYLMFHAGYDFYANFCEEGGFEVCIKKK